MTAAPVVAHSRIVGATVFSNAAHVVRRAKPELAPGLTRVTLPDLPRHLDPARLRVRTSLGRVRFVETDDLTWQKDATEPTSHEAEVAEARRRVHTLEGEQQALQAELQIIDRVIPGAGRKGPLAKLRPEAFLAGLEALTARRRAALERLRVVELERHEADERLETAQLLMNVSGTTESSARAGIVIGIEAEAEGAAELDVTYTADWATWRPYYTLRLGPGAKTVEVARYADVWQQTGESWTDLALTLSTAEPEEQLVLPVAQPWIISAARSYEDDAKALYAQRSRAAPAKKRAKGGPPMPTPMAAPAPMPSAPPPMQAMNRSMAMADEFPTGDLEVLEEPPDEMDMYAAQFEEEGIFAEITSSGLDVTRAGSMVGGFGGGPPGGGAMPPPPPPMRPPPPAPPPPEAHPDAARLAEATPHESSGGLDFEIEVPGNTTCKSGKNHHRIGLGRATFDTQVEYLLRPSLKNHAFGRATVGHAEEAPLLAGPAALFVEDAFFGNTRIETTPPGGKLVLDLGAETSIKCARRSETKVRTEGLISKEDVHTVVTTIEIESFLSEPVKAQVKDQIPVSQDDNIKVKLGEASGAKQDPKTGVLTFDLTLEPRVKKTLVIRYEIEAPKDYRLQRHLGEAAHD